MTVPKLPIPRGTPSGFPGGAPRRAPARPRIGPVGPRLLLRGTFIGVALLLLVVLLSSCAGPALPAAAPPPAAPAPAPSATPAPTTRSAPATTGTTTAPPSTTAPATPTTAGPAGGGASGGAARAGNPLWPAGDAATARRMQQQADRGGDPWLLDPEEVTISYVGAELGYRDPSLSRLDTRTFAVTDGRSPAKATVTLDQTVRRGPGGIWLVTRVEKY